MSETNVFTYRPNLIYVLEEVDTIYNVLKEDEQELIEAHIPFVDGKDIERYEKSRENFKAIYEEYKNKYSLVKYPLGNNLPAYAFSLIKGGESNNKITHDLDNGYINGDFISEFGNATFASEVLYHWNQQISSIHGNGVAEMMKLVEKINIFSNLFSTCLDKTLYLWYNIGGSIDKTSDFRKEYLLKVENLIKANNDRVSALNKLDDKGYVSNTQLISEQERFLNTTDNYLHILNNVSELYNVAAQQTADMIDDKKNISHKESVDIRVNELKKNKDLDNECIRVLLFNSYKKNKNDLSSLEAKDRNLYSEKNIYNVIDNFGRENKYFIEILNRTLPVMKNINENKYGYTNCLTDGVENIISNYSKTSVLLDSFVSSFSDYTRNYSNIVYKKNDIRKIYNAFVGENEET